MTNSNPIPRGVSDEVVKLVREAFRDGMDWADRPWSPSATAWDQSKTRIALNAMISAASPLHTAPPDPKVETLADFARQKVMPILEKEGLAPPALPDILWIEQMIRKLNPGRSEDHIKSVALDALSIFHAVAQRLEDK